MNFKTKLCARTIRNGIYAGDIFDIKEKDMIYNKEYKEKNKDKTVCSKVSPEKSIDYRPEEANTITFRMIRRFIPKGIDITPISEEFIQKIEEWINNHPKAMFNYKSINKILSELCV